MYHKLSFKSERGKLGEWESSYGIPADDGPLCFYEELTLECRISLVVCKLKDDAILGMSFLVKPQCSISFLEAKFELPDYSVSAMDRPVTPSNLEVAGHTEKSAGLISGKISKNDLLTGPLGMMEGSGDVLTLAGSIITYLHSVKKLAGLPS